MNGVRLANVTACLPSQRCACVARATAEVDGFGFSTTALYVNKHGACISGGRSSGGERGILPSDYFTSGDVQENLVKQFAAALSRELPLRQPAPPRIGAVEP